MNLLESFWFLVAFILIIIVLLIDPKSSITGANTSPMIGGMFSSPRSGQKFIYQLSGVLVTSFLILTVLTYAS